MNKNLYRIVFNQARGMLMVVADIAASGRAASSPSSGVGHTQRPPGQCLITIEFSSVNRLGLHLVIRSGRNCGGWQCAG